ncbi:MAG TPA: hypothetical protein VF331_27490 [Polyangiales bacterium]
MKNPFCLFGKRVAAPGLAVAAVLVLATQAHAVANPTCASLPNPVYIAGSSAVKPFAAVLAQALAAQATPITLIYSGPGSCIGVGYMTTNPPGKLTGGGTYWDTTLATPAFTGTCTTDDVNGGDTVNIGVSDVYAASCSATLDASVQDFHGPIQTMTFVVPISSTGGSTQGAISAEAAYLIYGFGGVTHPVSPWNDASYIEQRAATSGTQQMVAAYLGVPAAKFKGHGNGSSTLLIGSLATSLNGANAEKAIGILGADGADKNRTSLRELAYQHFNQSCAYLPDSSAMKFDKANTRDGHYPIWGPLHLITPVTSGVPTNANVKTVIDYLTLAVAPSFDLITVEAKGGVVPECAMSVAHTEEKDAAPMKAFSPTHSCACKFDVAAAAIAGASAPACATHTCTAANGTTDAACPTGAKICNYGYCEAK